MKCLCYIMRKEGLGKLILTGQKKTTHNLLSELEYMDGGTRFRRDKYMAVKKKPEGR